MLRQHELASLLIKIPPTGTTWTAGAPRRC